MPVNSDREPRIGNTLFSVVAIATVWLLSAFVGSNVSAQAGFITALTTFVVALVGEWYWFRRPTEIYRRRMKLAKLGCCPDCGYILMGNVSGRCPECGNETPSVWRNRPPMDH